MPIDNQDNTLVKVIQSAINEALSNTHTSTIAKVTKITGNTISVKPVFKRVIDNVEIELPEFAEVPIFTLQGGSNYRIMPIAIGDTALLIFSERCIDDWYYGADNKRPREYRMHDYSDAIALIGLNNILKKIDIPSGFEKVNGNVEHTGDLTQTGNYNLTGIFQQTGDYNLTGNSTISGNMSAAGFKVGTTSGVDGSFTTADGKTVTVSKGIITSIV